MDDIPRGSFYNRTFVYRFDLLGWAYIPENTDIYNCRMWDTFIGKHNCRTCFTLVNSHSQETKGLRIIMKALANRVNYILSGKWQPEWIPTFGLGRNIPASFSSGQTFTVPANSLQYPPGVLGFFQGLLGQRIYQPLPIPQ